MKYCTRIFTFDAAHKVLEHKSMCKYLHGHTYKLELTCCSPELDKLGMVADFADIKRVVETWLKENMDHNTILNSDDPLARYLNGQFGFADNHNRRPYLLASKNPTAENLAEIISHVLDSTLMKELKVDVYAVKLWETPNCCAIYPNPKFK